MVALQLYCAGTHVVGLTEKVIGSLEEALEHVVEAERGR